jgi:rubrerythrin
MGAAAQQLWMCTSCGFIFEEIPDDWFCPVCGARKADFEPFEG